FFFSSRRRHTRFSRDWSSDVCSSDLRQSNPLDPSSQAHWTRYVATGLESTHMTLLRVAEPQEERAHRLEREFQAVLDAAVDAVRSEERRVGKEWRSRWGPDQSKQVHD